MTHFLDSLGKTYNIDKGLLESLLASEKECKDQLDSVNEIAGIAQLRVLRAFQKNNVSDFHLNGSTGYGYGDNGRDILEKVFASVFNTERALVRAQIISGTHAIALGLFGNLENGDELISVTGKPYDTLLKVIGLNGEKGSLVKDGVIYKEIPLKKGMIIDTESLLKNITSKTKILYFQRSRGYEWRPSFSIDDLARVITRVKELHPDLICMVDNCYGEFVEPLEPTDVGADLVAGSLIKNPGGGLALTGGYLAGKEEYINSAAVRLTAPGISSGMGASLNFNHSAFQGLFMAPLIVGESLKGALLAAVYFQRLGYKVLPLPKDHRTDIIQSISLGSRELMIAFCQGLQSACPLDSMAKPEPAFLPGYVSEVIMAGGTFIQGSSIELSADGPIRPPYNIYLQGGLSFSHIKIGLLMASQKLLEKERDL